MHVMLTKNNNVLPMFSSILSSLLSSLRVRILLILAGGMSVLIIIIALLTFAVQREQANVAVETHLLNSTALVADAVDFMLNSRKKAIRGWAEVHLKSRSDSTSTIPPLVERAGLQVLFDNLLVLSPEGVVIDDWPVFAVRDGADISHRGYYTDALLSNDVVISEPFLSAGVDSPVPLVNLSYAVRDEDNAVIAILVASMELRKNALLTSLEQTRLGDSGYISVVSANGVILSHPDQEFIMQGVPEDREAYLDRVKSGWQGVTSTTSLRNVQTLQAYQKLPQNDWIIAGIMPVTEAYQQADSGTRKLVGVVTLTVLFIIAILGFLLNLQLRRLPQLTEELRQLDAGSRGRLKPVGYTEIDTLVAQFNQLIHDNHEAQNELQYRQAYLDSILEASSAGLFVTDEQGRAEYVNSAVTRITGWPSELFIEGDWCRAMPEKDAEQVIAAWQSVLEKQTSFSLDHRYQRPDGSIVWVNCQVFPIRVNDELLGMAGTIVDVSERYERERELITVANEDSLTKLHNRRSYDERVEQLFELYQSEGSLVSLLAIDLDHFKQVNDAAGHATGDWVLQQVGHVILRQVRVNDFAARIGGDEFAVLLRDCSLVKAVAIAEEICAAVAAIEHTHASVAAVTCSIGVAEIGVQDEYLIDWIRRADNACYAAKRQGRNGVITAD